MGTTKDSGLAAPSWDFVGHYVGRPSVAPDWGVLGQYEVIAEALLSIGRTVVDTAQIKEGESVLDVGTRSGDWALLAAEAGGRVTGIDFSPRLLALAQSKFEERYPEAQFELADVAKMPFADDSFDVVIDVVALMFGDDQKAAVAEMARVLKPGGRIVWTGWCGGDAIAEVAKIQMETTAEVLGYKAFPYSYWGVEDDMRELFGAAGFDIKMEKHPMVNEAPSARALLEGVDQVHPISRGCSMAMEKAGILDETMTKMVDVLENRNENPDAFKASRHYAVGVATRKPS